MNRIILPGGCFRWHNSVQPGRFSAGASRMSPGRLKLALQPFGVLKARKGCSRATFQLWSEFRRHLNKPESSSLMTTSSAASAFGWQRRKESDDIKPLVPSRRRRLKEGTILSPVEDDAREIGVRLDAMIPLIWGQSGGALRVP